MATYIWPPVVLTSTPPVPIPVEFVRNGSNQQVIEDTATPANNRPLPGKVFIQKDGVTVPVNKDTGTPANTVGVPVEIVAASGTPINITAGDINVQLTDLGVNFDRTRIGNGVNQWDMNASGEGLVHDEDVLQKLIDIENILAASSGLQAVDGPVIFDTTGLTTTPVAVVASLAGDMTKMTISNNSGNNILLSIGGAGSIAIPKGANFAEISIRGATGQAVEVQMFSGVGTAGELSLSFLGA